MESSPEPTVIQAPNFGENMQSLIKNVKGYLARPLAITPVFS